MTFDTHREKYGKCLSLSLPYKRIQNVKHKVGRHRIWHIISNVFVSITDNNNVKIDVTRIWIHILLNILNATVRYSYFESGIENAYNQTKCKLIWMNKRKINNNSSMSCLQYKIDSRTQIVIIVKRTRNRHGSNILCIEIKYINRIFFLLVRVNVII